MADEIKLVQVVSCGVCGSTFLGCAEPYCYTDEDYHAELRGYVKDGCTVKMMDAKDFKFQSCKCNKTETNE